jgi:hypothetical protein
MYRAQYSTKRENVGPSKSLSHNNHVCGSYKLLSTSPVRTTSNNKRTRDQGPLPSPFEPKRPQARDERSAREYADSGTSLQSEANVRLSQVPSQHPEILLDAAEVGEFRRSELMRGKSAVDDLGKGRVGLGL